MKRAWIALLGLLALALVAGGISYSPRTSGSTHYLPVAGASGVGSGGSSTPDPEPEPEPDDSSCTLPFTLPCTL